MPLRASWGSVAIGGGGYVTGLVQSANAAYARCDVGGAYLLPFKNGSITSQSGTWHALLDWVPPRLSNYYSIESIAVESASKQQSEDIIWMAVGDGFRMPSAILKSVDGGATFSNQSYVVPMAGNGNFRWCGERLAILPGSRGESVLFASRTHGVLKSVNGSKWARISSLPEINDPGYTFLLATPTGHIFAGAYGVGVYESTDEGTTWSLITRSPKFACRAAYRPHAEEVVITSNASSGSGSTGAVATLSLKTAANGGSWTDISPIPNQSYTGVAVDSSGDVYVTTNKFGGNSYHNPVFSLSSKSKSSSSTTQHVVGIGGTQWRLINNASAVTRRGDVPWWGPTKFASADSALLVVNGDLLLTATWYGVWLSSKRANFASWTTREKGHEEVVVLEVVAPASGAADLFTGVADVEGFRHTDTSVYPHNRLSNGTVNPTQSTSGIDVCPSNASVVARVHGNQGYDVGAAGAISYDNGISWRAFSGIAHGSHGHLARTLGGRIQFVGGADDCSRLVYIPLDSPPYASADGGLSWKLSTGAPNGTTGTRAHWEGCECRRWACDRHQSHCYIYVATSTRQGSNGTLSVSSDGGLNWVNSSAPLPAPTDSAGHLVTDDDTLRTGRTVGYVATNFANVGELCVCLGNSGLWCSTDAGATLTRVTGVHSCSLVDWGAPAPGEESGSTTMFIFGQLDESASDDATLFARIRGSWFKVSSDAHRLGRTSRGGPLAASKKKFGEVFLATDGTGVLRGALSVE